MLTGRITSGLIVVAATLTICAASLYINIDFAARLGATDTERVVYAVLGGAIDVFKWTAPFLIALALYQRQWGTALLASVMFAGAIALSTTAAVGFFFQAREQAVLSGEATNAPRAAMQRQLTMVRRQLDAQPDTRSSLEVTALIRQEERLRKSGWAGRREALRVELATAETSERLFAEEKRLSGALVGTLPTQSVRAQARALSLVLPGVSVEKIDMLMALALSLLVEVFSAFGLFCARAFLKSPSAPANVTTEEAVVGTLPAPANDVVDHPTITHLRAFKESCVVERPGAQVTAAAMYDGYKGWCGEQGLEPLTAMRFGSLFWLLLDRDERPDGRRTYRSVMLRRPAQVVRVMPGELQAA